MEPATEESLRDVRKHLHSHQDDQCPAQCSQSLPIHAGRSTALLLVPCYNRDRRDKIALRHRNAGISGYGNGRTHTGHNFEWNTSLSQRQCLFTTAPKDKRISTFQAYHYTSPSRICDE